MSADDERLAALREEIDSVERPARHVDLGARAIVISVALLTLLVAMVLPWIGTDSGLDVLRGTGDPAVQRGALPRLFAVALVCLGVVLSTVTLLVRRWGLVWASAFGSGYATLDGFWAIWSRQTAEGAGPGIGMVLATLAAFALAVNWFTLAASR